MIDFGELEHEVGGIMSMDRLHVEWLLRVLREIEPRCVVEIGCWKGVSTTAIAEACRGGHVDEAHLIDIDIKPTVRQLANAYGFAVHQMRSVEALPLVKARGDVLVVVDGDHSLACVRDELPLILAMQPGVIVAHDVTAEAAGYGECDGARWLWEELQRAGWLCTVDCRRRPGASTHRGLLVACRDLLDAEVVRSELACLG
jgi:predicted O-methyltransferase YrrM